MSGACEHLKLFFPLHLLHTRDSVSVCFCCAVSFHPGRLISLAELTAAAPTLHSFSLRIGEEESENGRELWSAETTTAVVQHTRQDR